MSAKPASDPAAPQEILIVEDDALSREALVDILENEGYRVTCATNGQEALDQLHDAPLPCLILLDLKMPVMDGWEFQRQQRQDAALAGIPVVVMTGVDDSEQQALSVAAADYFMKPYNIKGLLETIARYCQAPRAS